MSKSTIARGNILRENLIQISITPAAFSAFSSLQTFAVQDLLLNDFVEVNPGSAQTASVGIGGTRVSAANVLEICFLNTTGTTASITPVAGLYNVQVSRCEDQTIPANTL
jgi:hypothetical protein